jgi:hypothetical protein
MPTPVESGAPGGTVLATRPRQCPAMSHLARSHLAEDRLDRRNKAHEVDEAIGRRDKNDDRDRQIRDHLLEAEVPIRRDENLEARGHRCGSPGNSPFFLPDPPARTTVVTSWPLMGCISLRGRHSSRRTFTRPSPPAA